MSAPNHVAAYGDAFADVYDAWYGGRLDPADAVTVLTDLARGGRVLEFGVGTGRIALPLAAHGVSVVGIEASPAMLDKLRSKPDAASIEVHLGDMADHRVEGRFDVVCIPFSTLFLLPSQERQLDCFANAAAHLDSDGAFVVEAFVPDATRYINHQSVSVEDLAPETLRLEIARHDPVAQRVEVSRLVVGKDGFEVFPLSWRYATPAELDLMARLAGLHMRVRWGGWDRRPFTSASTNHVTVYERQ
jgi:SAM-dependent methyltransferase